MPRSSPSGVNRRITWHIVPRLVVALALVPIGITFIGAPLYLDPGAAGDLPPGSADAIVALGGIEETAARGYVLAEAGVAPYLVIADPYGERRPPNVWRLCRSNPAGVEVSCFDPEPSTTRGEAREIRRLADIHGWDSVVVVAPTYHVTRAKWIIGRCYDGAIVMADTGESFGPHTWAYEYVYQSVAFVKAAVFQRGC